MFFTVDKNVPENLLGLQKQRYCQKELCVNCYVIPGISSI